MEAKQILGLDVGKVRTGIARASSVARLAEPLMSVETSKLPACLQELLANDETEAVAVGLPRNLKGEDTAQTTWVRKWASGFKQQIDVPLFWQDEALTSKQAENLKLKAKSYDEHSLAAAIILQDFLDGLEAERTAC